MTKPEPVCGALTHKKTRCQNTLVTGCGLCPVHASQLRAASSGFKQKSSALRKKPPTAFQQTEQLTPSTLLSYTIPLNDQQMTQTPVAKTRPVHEIAHPDTSIEHDQFLYNITPVQQPQNDFYEEQPVMQTVKNETEVLDILKMENFSIVSPVTPKAPDASLKGDLFPADDDEEYVKEDVAASNHSTSGEHDLQGSPERYLLDIDLSLDLQVPKFD